MAKKRSKSRAQRLKQNARVRSEQVARNVVNNIDAVNPATVSRGTVKQLSRPELERLALNVGRSFGDVQHVAQQYAQSHAFFENPPITASKKDVMFAERTMPSLEEIASLPPRKAKLARQQRRKITAARNTVEAEKRFNADLMQGMSVQDKSDQWDGASGGHEQQLHDADQHFSSDISHAKRYRNVLKNKEIVSKLSSEELVREILSRKDDIKLADGLQNDKPVISSRDDAYVVKRLKAAFGGGAAKSWGKLSKSDRYALLNQTSFLNKIEFYSVYNDETHQFEEWDHDDEEKTEQERDDVMAFMRSAKKISGMKVK